MITHTAVAIPSNAVPAAAAQSVRRSSPYIVAPWYDWLFFLIPPVVALWLGWLISGTAFSDEQFTLAGEKTTMAGVAIGTFIHAHLVIVLFRSHGNTDIFKQHPIRFLLVPPVLYLVILSSVWIGVAVSVLGTFWDVYHSALQTFGFARIYDKKDGNDPQVGRRLDYWLNLMLYAGPILAGVTLVDHISEFDQFKRFGDSFFTAIPAFMTSQQRYFTYAVLIAGSAFLVYYVHAYWKIARSGYRVSFQKVYLLTTTGMCSIYAWGFNSWGEAFFIMNFFHAVQYFGLVWAHEKGRMIRMFRVENVPFGKQITLAIFVGLAFAYGYGVQISGAEIEWLWGFTLVVSILHFWYDGFIWSVRKKQV